ncbi:hypothetical protein PR048_030877 [Dryococelus australis]|uniref:Headcase middle domain-containing protein n=1 Tax=Dryococelus australis TaxID=614101 RepID=A0ABQ9GA62_9NEOP|nr:hypothetical protein PR048_030877 [Dryococelus australis]
MRVHTPHSPHYLPVFPSPFLISRGINVGARRVAARPRPRRENAIRARLTYAPSVSSLLRARRAKRSGGAFSFVVGVAFLRLAARASGNRSSVRLANIFEFSLRLQNTANFAGVQPLLVHTFRQTVYTLLETPSPPTGALVSCMDVREPGRCAGCFVLRPISSPAEDISVSPLSSGAVWWVVCGQLACRKMGRGGGPGFRPLSEGKDRLILPHRAYRSPRHTGKLDVILQPATERGRRCPGRCTTAVPVMTTSLKWDDPRGNPVSNAKKRGSDTGWGFITRDERPQIKLRPPCQNPHERGRGGVVVRLLASHPAEPASIPGGVAPRFPYVVIVPNDVAGRRVFSGISHFPRLFIPALLHSHLASPSSALKTSMTVDFIGISGVVCYNCMGKLLCAGDRSGVDLPNKGEGGVLPRTNLDFKETLWASTACLVCPNETPLIDMLALHLSTESSSGVPMNCIYWLAMVKGVAIFGYTYSKSAETKGRGKRDIPEKTCRQLASSGTIREDAKIREVTRPGIESGSPWREVSSVTTTPPRSPPEENKCAIDDKASTFEINPGKMSLPMPAYTSTGAPSDMRPLRLHGAGEQHDSRPLAGLQKKLGVTVNGLNSLFGERRSSGIFVKLTHCFVSPHGVLFCVGSSRELEVRVRNVRRSERPVIKDAAAHAYKLVAARASLTPRKSYSSVHHAEMLSPTLLPFPGNNLDCRERSRRHLPQWLDHLPPTNTKPGSIPGGQSCWTMTLVGRGSPGAAPYLDVKRAARISPQEWMWDMEDEGNHGNDETRCFILSTLAAVHVSKVTCLLCRESLAVYDRYPLIDGTFFLSPRQHAAFCLEDKIDVNHVYTEVDFAIGSQFIRHALGNSDLRRPYRSLAPQPQNERKKNQIAYLAVAAWLKEFLRPRPKSVGALGATETCTSNSLIASTRKALNWRAVLPPISLLSKDVPRSDLTFGTKISAQPHPVSEVYCAEIFDLGQNGRQSPLGPHPPLEHALCLLRVAVVRLLASYQGKPDLITGGIAPGFSHVRMVPDNDVGRRFFSAISLFPPLLHSGDVPYSPQKLSILRCKD